MYVICSDNVFLRCIKENNIETTVNIEEAKKYISPLDIKQDIEKLKMLTNVSWKYTTYNKKITINSAIFYIDIVLIGLLALFIFM